MEVNSVYVPWLHMHQPLIWKGEKLISNLEKMFRSKCSRESWDAKLIARAYKNPAKYVKLLKKEGRKPKIILDISGILIESLEELSKSVFRKVEVEGEKIGDIIKLYKEVLRKFPDAIEIAGTAYSHCYFPATPSEDWKYQIEEWRGTFKKIFGKKELERVKGFWFPEMGIPASEDSLAKLIGEVKDSGYEWCFLPLQAVEGYEKMSYEKRIQTASRPHKLVVKGKEITVVFRIPTYFIDQQAGCDANELYNKIIKTRKILTNNKPALIVPASDGENGNVMMNEFFPKTYLPLFREKIGNVNSMLITEFIQEYYQGRKLKPIKVKLLGASWANKHELWVEGTRRAKMKKKLEKLSIKVHKAENSMSPEQFEMIKRYLLIAETSCYVYWNVDFWFRQGEKTIEFVHKKLSK